MREVAPAPVYSSAPTLPTHMAPGHEGLSELVSAQEASLRPGAGVLFSVPLLSPYVSWNVVIFKVQKGASVCLFTPAQVGLWWPQMLRDW